MSRSTKYPCRCRTPTADWMNYSPILFLPQEVRTPLWRHYLGPKERKAIRAVCKTFQSEIDTDCGLSIDLDERFFDIRKIVTSCPVSASHLRVWGCDKVPDYLSRILYNGRLISSVTLSGPQEVSQFKKILGRCPNLSQLSISDQCSFEGRLIVPFKLRNVRGFHVGKAEKKGLKLQDAQTVGAKTPWSLYSQLLDSFTFPCLRTLKLEYTLDKEESKCKTTYIKLFTIFMKYLLHHKHVKNLTIRLHKATGFPPGTQCRSLQPPLTPYETSSIKSLSFKHLSVSTGPEVAGIWETILETQSQLEFLDFLNQGLHWVFFAKLVKTNRRTLKTIRLRRLFPPVCRLYNLPESRIDLGTFEFDSCPRLEEIFLSRFENATKEICQDVNGSEESFLDKGTNQIPEILRFSSLPKSLVKLHIQGFTARSEDLATIPNRAKNLRLVELQFLGYNSGGGSLSNTSIVVEKGAGGDTFDEIKKDVDDDDSLAMKSPRSSITSLQDKKRKMLMSQHTSHEFGVSLSVLTHLLTKLRSLDVLFVEEFENDHTRMGKNASLCQAIKSVNLIPGDCRRRDGTCYGVLVAKNPPILHPNGDSDGVSGSLEKDDKAPGDLWDVRFQQYVNQYKAKLSSTSIQTVPRPISRGIGGSTTTISSLTSIFSRPSSTTMTGSTTTISN